jgi:di/tricarboxylate transporter
MIPLSYAAILGGTCTLIGTSTNLIIQGFLLAQPGQRGLSLFEPAWVGVPSAVAGIIYILIMSPWLLPARTPVVEQLKRPREYTVEMIVDEDSPLAGKSVEHAGLRQLNGLYLVEIDRVGEVVPAAGPEELLRAGDRLVFAGITDSIMDLQRIRGLTPATNQVFKLDSPRPMREFIEAVVSASGPAVNKTVRESGFRARYGAVVIAVARDGQRIVGKIGDIELEPGDTLLLEAEAGFARRYANSRDFLLLRPIDSAGPPRHGRGVLALVIFSIIILAAGFQLLDLFTATLLGAGLLLLTRCVSPEGARASIDMQVILAVACAFGISSALRTTGAGEVLASFLVTAAGSDPFRSLVAIYIATVLLTEVMTHSASAALMFPIAAATATRLHIDLVPFAIAIMMAASASFATPIGYATNLMVYGPGGYRFTDFLRLGAPLNITVGVISLLIIPRVWPLT